MPLGQLPRCCPLEHRRALGRAIPVGRAGPRGSGEAQAPGEGMAAEALALGLLPGPKQPQTDFLVSCRFPPVLHRRLCPYDSHHLPHGRCLDACRRACWLRSHRMCCPWYCRQVLSLRRLRRAGFQAGAPRVLPGQLDAGKTLPNQVQARAKEEWADAMSAAAAAAEHARRAQDASDAAERYARSSTSAAAPVSPAHVMLPGPLMAAILAGRLQALRILEQPNHYCSVRACVQQQICKQQHCQALCCNSRGSC